MNVKILVVSALCSPFLVACGGGGGGGTSTPAPSSGTTPSTEAFPTPLPTVGVTPPSSAGGSLGPAIAIDAAFSALYTTKHFYERTQQDPATGITYYGVADYRPGPDTTIEGGPVKSTSVFRTLRQDGPNGPIVSQSAETQYFQTGPYKLIAIQSFANDGSPSGYRVASEQQNLPTIGYAGQSALFYNAVDYGSAFKQLPLAKSTNQWEITADTQDTLSFCVNSVTVIAFLPGTNSKADCYKVSTVTDTRPSAVTAVGFVVPKK